MTRLCVKFFPSPNAVLNSPQPILVYRGRPQTFADLWQACAERLPLELTHLYATGHILIGRESDPWIKNPSPIAKAAKYWAGKLKSGSFEDLLRRETASHFTALTESVV